MTLSTPIGQVPRVGMAYEKKLQKLGITTVRDLLFHFPRNYQDFSKITPIKNLKEGEVFCVAGKLLDIQETRSYYKKVSVLTGLVEDKTGAIKLTWFNQPYLADSLKKGDQVYLAGKVLRDKEGVYLANPIHEKTFPIHPRAGQGSNQSLTHVGRIIPIYPETAGVSSRWLRSIVKMVLAQLQDTPETLPEEILQQQKFLPIKQALWQIHFPDSMEKAEQAARRFSFEELFYILLFILSERKKIAQVKAPSIPFDTELMKRFTDKLAFQLTDDQKKAAWHLLKDMEKPRPMNRLLQGDVGSGKTVVAAMAMLSAVRAGHQAALLAPTEILAQQHHKTVAAALTPFRLTIGLLTGKTDRLISPKLPNDYIEISRAKLLEKVLTNEVQVLIGTHSLIQDKVKFGDLALVVVDEQHRFGVKQRMNLLHKDALIPHLLSMTATPIPRTLAMTLYGDLDLSTIVQLPKGRKPITTQVVAPQGRKKAYEEIREQIKQGRQVFVICPRIERTEKSRTDIEIKTVKEEYEKLSKEIFPDLRIEMLHGKMPQKEKEQTMRKFKFGKIDILVSTSVVEVGVDISNASVMMIEGAEHFGLAQLHQFRGRVGRAEHQSYCFLFAESNSHIARQRLKAMQEYASGFELAERDLKIRGPGDFAGTKQWGLPDFAMQNLTNLELVEQARESAKAILEKDIALKTYPLLREKVQDFRQKLHLE